MKEGEDKGAGPGAGDPYQAPVCACMQCVYVAKEVRDPGLTFLRTLDVALCAYLHTRLNTWLRRHTRWAAHRKCAVLGILSRH